MLDFLHSNSGCSENSALLITKTRHHEINRLIVGQLLHRVQTEEMGYKNVLLQPVHVPSSINY